MTGQNPSTTLDRVYDLILKRKQSSPETSYVAYLMDEGTDVIFKKNMRRICWSNYCCKKWKQEGADSRISRSLVSHACTDGAQGDNFNWYFSGNGKQIWSVRFWWKSKSLIYKHKENKQKCLRNQPLVKTQKKSTSLKLSQYLNLSLYMGLNSGTEFLLRQQ